jgi:TonB family protein
MRITFRTVSFIFALSLVAVGFSDNSWAQERRKEPFLEGSVRDFVTGSIISGASVLIEETGQRLISNDKGYFLVEGLKPGGYTIHVSHPQHRPLLFKNFQLTKGGVFTSFALRSGKPSDQPHISDGTPDGQFVIDEDAELIERREPKYPESALKEKAEGTILLWVGVDKNGEVGSATFKEGSKRRDLLEASIEAAQYFKFKPAKVKGRPVGVMVTVPFNFRLADKTTRYPLKQEEGPLSIEDITNALSYLGVNMRRFSYEVPYKHEIKVSMVERAEGKLLAETNLSFGKADAGKISLVLYKYEKDGAVEFTMSMSNPGRKRNLKWPMISVKGVPARYVVRVPETQLQSGVKIPIYVEALSSGGVNYGLDDPVEKTIARAPRSIAVYVELKLEN